MDFEKRLARAILRTQDIREESYDKVASDGAEEEGMVINYKQLYTLSVREAADEAAEEEGFDKRMTEPIYLLCQYVWNDIQDWAKKILEN